MTSSYMCIRQSQRGLCSSSVLHIHERRFPVLLEESAGREELTENLRAVPLNSTGLAFRHTGHCEYERQRCSNLIGAFCPRCDASGNFLPQQCSASTGYCWCVDPVSGAEIPNTQTPPGSVPVDCNKANYCPYGWSHYGKRCFIFINAPKTWTEAEIYCQFDGANLASVHSYEENHFVMSLTRGNTYDFPEAWIGGSDVIHPGFWMWSDGSKFDYENWYDEHHDEEEGSCLKMNYEYDLKWFHSPCNESYPFVCAKKC
ncbi:ladderlectin [Toxotes jaculatrix]|uniref:ladderlectin n=1 Tax=Toxotes jaculatrix TaxID=941984 RepID=UPI001B3B0C3B|nr:ladderlectin [Toxotes jaculatrix]